MDKYKHTIPFGIIGLGRFGLALAENLAKEGYDVLAIDSNEEKIQDIQSVVAHAFVVPHITKAALEETGIQNCHTVIICIGENIEGSIMATLNVIDLGVERVISKAISHDQGTVLTRIGAEVVFPEKDSAVRLAKSLTSSKIMHYIDISEEYDISEIIISSKLEGKSIGQLNFRQTYNLNIIAITKGNDTIIEISPDITLDEGDRVVLIGKRENIQRFLKRL